MQIYVLSKRNGNEISKPTVSKDITELYTKMQVDFDKSISESKVMNLHCEKETKKPKISTSDETEVEWLLTKHII